MHGLKILITLVSLGWAACSAAQFSVAAFGAKGDGHTDDGPAIQRAIEAGIAAGPNAEVAFEAGKFYRLATSTNDAAILRIGKARGLVLAGNGATLVTHPSNRPFSVFGSQEVTLRDLFLDYDPLPFTQARLTKLALAEGFIQFRVEPGYADPAAGGAEIYRDFKSSDAVFIDGQTRLFTHDWGRLASVKELGGHVFEARFHYADLQKRFARLKLGDFIVIKLHFAETPARRDAEGRYVSGLSANIYLTGSQNVRLERIVSYAAPGMTMVATGTEGVVLDGCQVVRKPKTDRLIASQSDGAHLKSLTVMPQIRNCVFEALMDDSINIKVSSEIVKEIKWPRVRLTHGDIATDDLVVQTGQSLQLLGGPGKRHLGYAKIVAVERVRYREAWVTLAAPVPELAVGDLVFLKPASDAQVSGCQFRSQLKTALLTHPPTVISDCSFAEVAYGIHAFFNDQIEGPPPFGLRVSRCEFTHPSVAAMALHLPSRAARPAGGLAFQADDCRVTMGNNRGAVLNAYNQDGILLRNLKVNVEDGRAKADLMRLHNCANVREENVVFGAGR